MIQDVTVLVQYAKKASISSILTGHLSSLALACKPQKDMRARKIYMYLCVHKERLESFRKDLKANLFIQIQCY